MTGIAGRSVYGISKAGLIQMTRMLAIEWADNNIRVNAIAPTTVLTPSRAAMYDDRLRQIAERLRASADLQGVVRQGQPHLGQVVSRPRPGRRAEDPRRGQTRAPACR